MSQYWFQNNCGGYLQKICDSNDTRRSAEPPFVVCFPNRIKRLKSCPSRSRWDKTNFCPTDWGDQIELKAIIWKHCQATSPMVYSWTLAKMKDFFSIKYCTLLYGLKKCWNIFALKTIFHEKDCMNQFVRIDWWQAVDWKLPCSPWMPTDTCN